MAKLLKLQTLSPQYYLQQFSIKKLTRKSLKALLSKAFKDFLSSGLSTKRYKEKSNDLRGLLSL